jgi:hypothetical protein
MFLELSQEVSLASLLGLGDGEKKIITSFEKELEKTKKLKIELSYFFSFNNKKGDFRFSSLLYSPYFARTDDPEEMYPIYFKIFTGEKKLVMLE